MSEPWIIIITTILAFANTFLPSFIKWVFEFIFGESSSEKELKKQIAKMKDDLTKISMVDEFAKYAKLERIINKAKDRLSTYNTSRSMKSVTISVAARGVTYFFTGLIFIYLMWSYHGVDLMYIPTYLVWPLDYFLGLGATTSGALGLTSWLMIVSRVSRQIF